MPDRGTGSGGNAEAANCGSRAACSQLRLVYTIRTQSLNSGRRP